MAGGVCSARSLENLVARNPPPAGRTHESRVLIISTEVAITVLRKRGQDPRAAVLDVADLADAASE